MKNFKIDYSSKNILGVYLVKYFWEKNGISSDL